MSEPPTLLGLSGYARSGKDTVGEMLSERYGYVRVAFADLIKTTSLLIDPYIPVRAGKGLLRLSDVVEIHGWTKAKEKYPEVRQFLQRYGSEAIRDTFGADFWVDRLFDTLNLDGKARYVFTDVRFPNEANRIAREGLVWRISRPGCEAANEHSSEHALDGYPFDAVIENDGSLNDLAAKIAFWRQGQ